MEHLRTVTRQSSTWFLLSGIGMSVGILWPFVWWLVFPGVASFLYAIFLSSSWQCAWWGGWLAGSIKIGCALGWIWTTYPLEWIDLGLGVFELPVIGFYWLTLAVVVGLGAAFTAVLLYLVREQSGEWWWGPVVVIGWLLGEVLGALCFSLFTFGEGGTVNALFSFGMVGNLLSEHTSLLQVARIGGVYALSALAVGSGALMFSCRSFLLSRHGLAVASGLLVVLIGSASFSMGIQNTALPATVAIIDTDFGGTDFFAATDQEAVKAKALNEAVKAAKAAGAVYILLPEGSHTMPASLNTIDAFRRFSVAYEESDSIIIESARTSISLHESAMRGRIYDEQAQTAYTVDKQRLVPQGEFMPVFYVTLLSQLGVKEAVKTIDEALDYRPGPYVSQASLPMYVPSVLFCFAEADPLSVRRFVRERDVPFIVNPISHAWFHSPESLWWQYDAMRKIHAVWNGVSIVTAGNMSDGAWYTTTGKKISPRVIAQGERWTVSVLP